MLTSRCHYTVLIKVCLEGGEEVGARGLRKSEERNLVVRVERRFTVFYNLYTIVRSRVGLRLNCWVLIERSRRWRKISEIECPLVDLSSRSGGM